MAEFQEVMRQFDRMCKAHAGCINCRLHHRDGYSDECSIGAFIRNTAEIEQKIMSWAAENPEPVYPTWREYLIKMGLIDFKPDFRSQTLENSIIECLNEKAKVPIPADLAKKLGIEPKEK